LTSLLPKSGNINGRFFRKFPVLAYDQLNVIEFIIRILNINMAILGTKDYGIKWECQSQ
jgi:hypothetical protein